MEKVQGEGNPCLLLQTEAKVPRRQGRRSALPALGEGDTVEQTTGDNGSQDTSASTENQETQAAKGGGRRGQKMNETSSRDEKAGKETSAKEVGVDSKNVEENKNTATTSKRGRRGKKEEPAKDENESDENKNTESKTEQKEEISKSKGETAASDTSETVEKTSERAGTRKKGSNTVEDKSNDKRNSTIAPRRGGRGKKAAETDTGQDEAVDKGDEEHEESRDITQEAVEVKPSEGEATTQKRGRGRRKDTQEMAGSSKSDTSTDSSQVVGKGGRRSKSDNSVNSKETSDAKQLLDASNIEKPVTEGPQGTSDDSGTKKGGRKKGKAGESIKVTVTEDRFSGFNSYWR